MWLTRAFFDRIHIVRGNQNNYPAVGESALFLASQFARDTYQKLPRYREADSPSGGTIILMIITITELENIRSNPTYEGRVRCSASRLFSFSTATISYCMIGMARVLLPTHPPCYDNISKTGFSASS
jgi:hypothetical protein